MQNRKENAQLIVSIDAIGRPVYVDGVPALLNRSLSRLKNILGGQVLHTTEEAYSACKAVLDQAALEQHAAVRLIEQNYSLSENLKKAYQEHNQRYLGGMTETEVEHWATDFHFSSFDKIVMGRSHSAGFVSRIHIAQYFAQKSPEGSKTLEVFYTDDNLRANGYKLESSDWESLPYRAGGPTCAQIRHTVWRHESARKQALPLLSVDDSAWAMAAAQRQERDAANRVRVELDEYENISVSQRIVANNPEYFRQLRALR